MQQYNLEEVKNYLAKDLEKLEGMLLSVLEDSNQLTDDISKKIFVGGGKRIRPILTILTGKLLNYEEENIFDLALAIELIHTSTLLHDDVVDGSVKRRGVSTANSTYGNKAPILVGDVLFAKSFISMVKTNSIEILEVLAYSSTIIAEGEVKQLELQQEKEKKSFLLDDYLEVIESKTAALFESSTQTAALLAGASEEVVEKLKIFGLKLGSAFQIIDDILDYNGDVLSLGKNVGDDFFEQKVTLPVILLYDESDDLQKERIRIFFKKDLVDENDLKVFLVMLQESDCFSKANKFAKNYIEESIKIIADFSDSIAKDMLLSICYITLSRVS